MAAAAAACQKNEKAPLALKERSQAVTASGPAAQAPPPSAAPTASVVRASAKKKPRRVLCAGQLDKPGRRLPESSLLSRAAAAGQSEPPAELPIGHGKWTWINLWAAWCAPCKEEMPRLSSWERKLTGAGKHFQLFFVSLDDDERQLKTFLGSQPSGTGVRASYWLRDGKHREKWLKGVGIEDDPELPVHVLVDPQGKVRCVMHGAMEDADFPQVEKIVSRR